MRVAKATTSEEANRILKGLNDCHDASLIHVMLTKDRSIDRETGDLVFPFDDPRKVALLNVSMKLLHDDYEGASRGQVVEMRFFDVASIVIEQESDQDYSDVYCIECDEYSNGLRFSFYIGTERTCCIAFTCRRFECTY